ncbi:DMT family transporter [Mesorhizobium sp. M1C.F.Ca.ET.193.01.1.1]|nr:DMT family transporter [Mesorhizobium sp. M1C.F.Ca.ET.210.01.1.1]TGQ75121.1 DMT family transporter [Mesorhizobium sp. M1C.F.Ca.ET.212.01.1.1]TGR13533.1 DMT family transporter [Mesorhizobium sp. M1C.F.Ca.ET.204.01.1.1]TGR33809.1 DMT family transporter [Mesorhizobium sp. M1C.F.Ca.ET.196.01.1.1]TGR56535.1 DMT family transporter [Mesorhizobium sp. M1C.F.Ca.ET.195.01.1.1]TGR68822.1 DMT family transporter [Mesorhizobium sp. M1C.F.Ca.ET.192.01.1.1]TGR83969.1 DMT family transporter [Mesorhizobium 
MSGAVDTLDRRDAVDMTAAAIMVGLTLSWGLNYVAAKVSYAGYDPVFVSIARSILGGFCVLGWCRLRGIRVFERDGTLAAGTVVGALFGVEFLFLYVGLEYTTVARNTLLVNTMPFWVLIGGHFLLGERITARKLAGLVLAFCGLVAVFSDGIGAGSGATVTGDLLSLGAGILWALTSIFIKRSKLVATSAERLLLYQLAGAAVVGALVMPLAGPPIREIAALPTLALLFQSFYIVAFTYVLWFWLLTRYPAAGLSSFAFLSPVFGVLCGAVLLGEPLTVRSFLALGLIAAGLIIVNRPARKQVPA